MSPNPLALVSTGGARRLPRPLWSVSAVGLVLALSVAACSKKEQAAPPAPPPPQVGVVTVQVAPVSLSNELPGRVEAGRTAQVRARVNGVVQKRLFQEGSDVKANQPLFEIDPAPYRAALASAQAQLARAQANLNQTAALVGRYKPLREANAISQQEYVNAQAGQGLAEADVAAAKAAIQTAQINLGYATVRAPISGRIGRALVTEGALASATEATQLALIQQIDPVYVNVSQPMSEITRLRDQVAAGQAKSIGDSVPVQVLGEDGRDLGRAGRLLFSDLSVDATSGQVLLRAAVPNTDMSLLPGQYVRVRLAQARLEKAILVPQQAVTRNATGDTVMVVGADNQPAQRKIRVDSSQNGQWVVLEGLQAGEKVIVDGFQKMRPGAPVQPVPWPDNAASAPAGAGARASASAPAAGASAAAPAASAPASR